MGRLTGGLYVGILLVVFAYALMALVKSLLPILIPLAAIVGAYCLMFKRPW